MNLESALARDRAAAFKLVRVSHETESRLDLFVNLFLRWQNAVQLVAKSTLPKLWTRHIADSLQLLEVAPDARVWVDLGSGGGFPGLMIAIAIADQPGAMVHLIESDKRKAAFLREAARVTQAPVQVHAERIESVAERIGKADVVTARALAPMTGCLQLAAPFLAAGSTGIFLKGQDVDNELTQAAKSWSIQYAVRQSLTDPGGRIVIVENAVPQLVTKY
jgi:16S rRNA (guanine527-N7)-methyltransferase